MSGLNRVTLIGNLGQDPEITTSRNGKTIAKISIATSDGMKAPGEDYPKTEWHRVVVFGSSADYVKNYIKKGATVCVEGTIQYGKYQNKDDQTVYTTDIICRNLTNLTKRDPNQAPSQGGSGYQNQQQGQQQENFQQPKPFEVEQGNMSEDDLPF